jgi:myo-inositol-1(or 4)-monophosphatase
MEVFKEFAVEIAHRSGTLLKERFGRNHKVTYKGEINIVTDADQLSEDMMKSAIARRFPDHGILAEESAEIESRSEYRWIIDPLDGTTNYAHGYPAFCVSVALEKSGTVILGVVFNPMLDETFIAQLDNGAYLNGGRITVSETPIMNRSLLATGFPYDLRENPDNNLNYFFEMSTQAQAVRRAGSAALELAYTAAGRFDGFWELRLKPWDTAAACLMVREAGGIVTDIAGNEHRPDSKSVLASNEKIHPEMLSILKKTSPVFMR